MKYSSYIKTCLRELQENREYETDIILGHMVRLQNLSEKITEITQRDEGSDDIAIPRAPVTAYISTFQGELDKIQGSISKTMKNNSKLVPSNQDRIVQLSDCLPAITRIPHGLRSLNLPTPL